MGKAAPRQTRESGPLPNSDVSCTAKCCHSPLNRYKVAMSFRQTPLRLDEFLLEQYTPKPLMLFGFRHSNSRAFPSAATRQGKRNCASNGGPDEIDCWASVTGQLPWPRAHFAVRSNVAQAQWNSTLYTQNETRRPRGRRWFGIDYHEDPGGFARSIPADQVQKMTDQKSRTGAIIANHRQNHLAARDSLPKVPFPMAASP